MGGYTAAMPRNGCSEWEMQLSNLAPTDRFALVYSDQCAEIAETSLIVSFGTVGHLLSYCFVRDLPQMVITTFMQASRKTSWSR